MGEACRAVDMAVAEWALRARRQREVSVEAPARRRWALRVAGHFERCARARGGRVAARHQRAGRHDADVGGAPARTRRRRRAGPTASPTSSTSQRARRHRGGATREPRVLPLERCCAPRGRLRPARARGDPALILRASAQRVTVVEGPPGRAASRRTSRRGGNTARARRRRRGRCRRSSCAHPPRHHEKKLAAAARRSSRTDAWLGRLDASSAARGASNAVDSNGDGLTSSGSGATSRRSERAQGAGIQEQKAPEDILHDHHGGGGNEHMYGGDQGPWRSGFKARERRAEGAAGLRKNLERRRLRSLTITACRRRTAAKAGVPSGMSRGPLGEPLLILAQCGAALG